MLQKFKTIRPKFLLILLAGLFFFALAPKEVQAATNVYYSVGQSAADLQTGTSTITISGGVATLSTAQTGNIGVGDRITYNGFPWVMITGKISSTQWAVQNHDGSVPNNDSGTVDSITREYTSLAAALAGAIDNGHLYDGNLAGRDVQLNFPCYYDSGPDTAEALVDGYTTDADNFIRIYTPTSTESEVNVSQRHQGKWSDFKYRMEASLTWTTLLTLRQSYTVLDGIQVDGANIYQGYGIKADDPAVPSVSDVVIKNNILKNFGTGNDEYAIGVSYPENTLIYNNIVYDGSGIGIFVQNWSGNSRLGNNTVYGMEIGIIKNGSDEPAIAVNNLAVGNGTDFYGPFQLSSNNLSFDNTATGTDSLTLTLVQFADEANKDFHLAASSSARDVGADLSDFYTADIDGHSRSTTSPVSREWDIGADEGAAAIYYSVGQNTSDHKAGSPTVTVSSSTGLATFSVGQTAVNMGVGDAITYGTDKCYITSKVSATLWYCVSATGTLPVATTTATVASVTHAFASLNDAVGNGVNYSANSTHLDTADLFANNYQLNLPCYYDSGANTAGLTMATAYVSGPANYIKIYTPNDTATEANLSQRHQGAWSDYKFSHKSSASFAVNVAYTVVDGLQLDVGGNGVYIYNNDEGLVVKNSIIRSSYGATYGIRVDGDGANKAFVYNNILYGMNHGIARYYDGGDKILYAFNNTVYGASSSGIFDMSGGKVVAINNLVQQSGVDFNGTFNASSSYNISSDGTAPGASSLATTSVRFADTANKDFHLAASSTARNRGFDLSAYGLDDDVDGHSRLADSPVFGAWDIGADEGAAAIYYSVGQNTNDHKTGSPTVTVSSTTGLATFSAAQTATNMGVGDLITYDTTSKCFITAKASTTAWYCATATGTAPVAATDATVNSITHAYASLSAAEAGAVDSAHLNTSDLASANLQLNIPCYYDSGPDTTAVDINGYTTGMSNFIRVYTPTDTSTEANASQRHSGVWDGRKYNLVINNNHGIRVQAGHVWLDGLQDQLTNVSSNRMAIFVTGSVGYGSNVRISNSILRGSTSTGDWHMGLDLWQTNGTGVMKFWNNVVYDFRRSANNNAVGIGIEDGPFTSYIYNNTFNNCSNGIYRWSGTGVLKNNIVQNSATAYVGSFHASSTNNISHDATSPNAPFRSKIVSFADTANNDFHLAASDVVAKNAGVDLSTDANLALSNDIDKNARPTQETFDIGADEAAKAVYYSVGQSTADLQTGTSTVSISSSTGLATFSATQTGNIGVGDRLTVSTSTVYYISGKASSTAWYVVSATGTLPQATTSASVTSIKREYTSLSAAVAGASDANHLNTADLTGTNVQLNLPTYYDSGSDTTAVTVSGYVTSAPNYIRIYTPASTTAEANFSQRHQGRWDDAKYNINDSASGNDVTLKVSSHYVRVDGLQIYSQRNNYQKTGINTDSSLPVSSDVRISNNILKANFTGSGNSSTMAGIYLSNNDLVDVKVWNNIIYDWNRAGTTLAGIANSYGSPHIYNNTVYNCYYGYYADQPNIITAKNNVAQNVTVGYYGTFSASSTSNISQDATSPNAGFQNKTVLFSDAANRDFHLSSSDAVAKNTGADLSADPNFAFGADIDGHARVGSWDIGADEGATAVYYSVGQNTSDHKTGSPTVTISSSTGLATFSVAQTATNMGVGDVITYGSDKCYITAKASTTAWYCATATGTMPVATSSAIVTSIAHAFGSLSAAVHGNGSPAAAGSSNSSHLNTLDLYSNNYTLNIPCYYDSGPDLTNYMIIHSWVTSQSNYINIYTPTNTLTEANANQRHSGRWEEGKYSLVMNGTSTSNAMILYAYSTSNVRIDGIQMFMNGYEVGGDSLSFAFISGGILNGEIAISNNIIKASSTSGDGEGLRLSMSIGGSNQKYLVYNNLFYGWENGGSAAVWSYANSIKLFNNTARDSAICYVAGNGTSSVLAKNNIAQCADGYNGGGFSASSSNNISSISSDAPGQNAKNSTTVAFADSANKDFHLLTSDTAAKNAGVDLSADPGFALNADIDGQVRNSAVNAWDIGADEGATAIYYSVGQNANDHKTGTPTVTVSSTTGLATFDVAQSATNMGVGDVITYDTANKCYITAKASTTAWYCATATGTAPVAATGATVNSIAHAFSSLSAAIAGSSGTSYLNTSNLVVNNYQLNLPCYYDSGADTTNVNVAGYVTGLPNYLKIYTPIDIVTEVNMRQRHQGKWDDVKYRISKTTDWGDVIAVSVDHLQVIGLQVDALQANTHGIYLNNASGEGGSNRLIYGNIIKNSSAIPAGRGIQFDGYQTVTISNNLVYNFGYAAVRSQTYEAYGKFIIYNNTVLNSQRGFSGIPSSANSKYYIKNNIAQNNPLGDYTTGGTATANNISGDGSSPDVAYRNKTVNFVDATNKDFHLVPSDMSARNAGADLSADSYYAINADIDGHARPNGDEWDVGADEAANAVYYSVGQSTADLKTGSPTVSITSGTATFSVAQAGNIGVGDRVTYNSSSSVAYISGKASTSVWYVVTATGTMPADITDSPVDSIKREYTSLSSAIAGGSNASHLNTTDLHSNNMQLNFPTYYDSGADSGAVTLSGYSTSIPNFVRIYSPNNANSESNNSQRHNGKWDNTKYRIENSSMGVDVRVGNAKLDGLQIKVTRSTQYAWGIRGVLYGRGGQLFATNNIIQGIFSGTAHSLTAISLEQVESTLYAANNSVDGFINGSSTDNYGISVLGYNDKAYLYNNTINNSFIGIYNSGSNAYSYAKNNITQNCTDGFNGPFDSSSNYNISDLASDAPGANSKNGVKVDFVDAANKDFHIKLSDKYARDAGANLSADANYAFNIDTDGQARGKGLGWDIGADETGANVYYSVGQNTDDHKTGSSTVTISGSTATFSVAQTAANMGVGDVVTYGTDKCYIAGKQSQTAWSCVTATGTLPVATTTAPVASIAHAFPSLSAAISGASGANYLNTANLTSANAVLNLPCYYDSGPDVTPINVGGYTAGTDNYIKIYTPHDTLSEVNNSQRHAGKPGTGYRIRSNTKSYISSQNVKIDGIELYSDTGTDQGLRIDPTGSSTLNISISNSILHGFVDGVMINNTLVNMDFWNNVVYDCSSVGFYNVSSGLTGRLYNNTFYNTNGFRSVRYTGNGTLYLYNNIVNGTFNMDYNIWSTIVNSGNNISSDGSSPDVAFRNKTVIFISTSTKDFHLSNQDTAARDAGISLANDPYLPVGVDIDGQNRPIGGVWDIGADEDGGSTRIRGGVKVNGAVKVNKY